MLVCRMGSRVYPASKSQTVRVSHKELRIHNYGRRIRDSEFIVGYPVDGNNNRPRGMRRSFTPENKTKKCVQFYYKNNLLFKNLHDQYRKNPQILYLQPVLRLHHSPPNPLQRPLPNHHRRGADHSLSNRSVLSSH